MDLKQVKELIQLLEKSGLNKLTIKEKGYEISLEKGAPHAQIESYQSAKRELAPPLTPQVEPHLKHETQAKEVEVDVKHALKSPMVGMFYRSPTPNDPPFVREGDVVEKGSVICIIEAMKVMNEIKSDRKGKVVKILVDNGHPVEFGQPLFVIE
jgi:acetyl-CoA carboxylase biotin carboxyl carrier protein